VGVTAVLPPAQEGPRLPASAAASAIAGQSWPRLTLDPARGAALVQAAGASSSAVAKLPAPPSTPTAAARLVLVTAQAVRPLPAARLQLSQNSLFRVIGQGRSSEGTVYSPGFRLPDTLTNIMLFAGGAALASYVIAQFFR
jgi:hypothetical protein